MLQEKYNGEEEDWAHRRTTGTNWSETKLSKKNVRSGRREKPGPNITTDNQLTAILCYWNEWWNHACSTGPGEFTLVDSQIPPTHAETTMNTVNSVVDTSAVPYNRDVYVWIDSIAYWNTHQSIIIACHSTTNTIASSASYCDDTTYTADHHSTYF